MSFGEPQFENPSIEQGPQFSESEPSEEKVPEKALEPALEQKDERGKYHGRMLSS